MRGRPGAAGAAGGADVPIQHAIRSSHANQDARSSGIGFKNRGCCNGVTVTVNSGSQDCTKRAGTFGTAPRPETKPCPRSISHSAFREFLAA